MENKGLVSIIMPSYNSEKYIKDSIESVLNQTYPFWELLIVDDCSTDNTVDIIKSFEDERIKLFQNKTNSGAAISRNRALREAKGKWIAFLDSDDLWLPTKLEEQIKFMLDNNYHFSFTDYRICLNGKWEDVIHTAPNKINFRKIKKYCYFSTITVMYDMEKVGLVQIGDIRKNNDYAMWLKILKNVDAYRYPHCLSFYIKHNNSISSGSKLKLIKWHYILFRKECKYGRIHSIMLTIGNLWYGLWKKFRYKESIRGGVNEQLQ